MPDENKSAENTEGQTGETEGGTTSEGAVGDAGQPYVTQEQLGAVVEEKLKTVTDSMFSMVRKMTADAASKSDPKPDPKPPTADETTAELRRELDAIKAQRLFDRAVPADMPTEERSTLERLFAAEHPEDPAAWLVAELKDRSQTILDPAPGHQAPKGATPGGETAADILTWTKEDYQREFEQKAKDPSNVYSIENKPFYTEIRKRAEARLKDTMIELPRRGQKE